MGCLILASLLGCSAAGTSSGAGADGGGGSGATSGSGGSGGEGTTFDPSGGGGSAGTDECKNVDLLFVIDDSGSMGDNQESLIASFPGFVSEIQSKLAGAQSYHIGVVTTEDYYSNEAGCTEIGDLVTKTGGPESSNKDCGPFGGGNRRYLDETDANLGEKFACIGKVGAGGDDDERVARALLNALDPARNAPGGCNAGFSRLDSLLIVVIITDEDDVPDGCESLDPPTNCMTYGSGGTPQEWYDEVIALKGGIPENVVVLSLLGLAADNACGAQVAAKLIGFTNRFGERGYKGDVCAASYDGFFAETLPVIDKACEEYVEPK